MKYRTEHILKYIKRRHNKRHPKSLVFVNEIAKWYGLIFNGLVFFLKDMEPGDKLHMKGFGTFICREVPKRYARNPKKNLPITIPRRTRLKFIPTISIKEVYDNYFLKDKK